MPTIEIFTKRPLIKLAICGPGRSGKDTVAKLLSSVVVGLMYKNSGSWYAKKYVFDNWPNHTPRASTSELLWENRSSFRDVWADLIDKYNHSIQGNDSLPTRLYEDCLAENDIVTGIRKKKELMACKEKKLFTHYIWIESDMACYDRDQGYGSELCDCIINNNKGNFSHTIVDCMLLCINHIGKDAKRIFIPDFFWDSVCS